MQVNVFEWVIGGIRAASMSKTLVRLADSISFLASSPLIISTLEAVGDRNGFPMSLEVLMDLIVFTPSPDSFVVAQTPNTLGCDCFGRWGLSGGN